jgi:hypothetical protein
MKTDYQPTEEVIRARRLNSRYTRDLRERLRDADSKEALDWQEKHDPTDPVMVRVDATRVEELGRRRSLDNKLWTAMSVEQIQAALEIRDAFEIVTGGLGSLIAHYAEQTSRGLKCLEDSEYVANLQITYSKWGADCARRHISVSAVLDVLCFGESCRQVDAARRHMHGWMRAQLFDALTVYAQIRGWLKKNS